MTRPLYDTAVREPESRGREGHAGLWYDKFCDQWRRKDGSWTMSSTGEQDNPKLVWIRTLVNGRVGTQGQIEEYAMRLLRLVERRNGRAEAFTTEFRFVTGLGRSHPVENGLAWHPTLGTPYLPGSSVKGLVRSWAKTETEPRSDKATLNHLLGTVGRAGSIGFLDAVPIAPVRLEADVMTPHYAGWSKDDPPGDWCSPTPIPFLATAAETSFLFGIIPCRAVADDGPDTVADWLRSALAWAGAGAKTAIGYGRFRHDDAQTRSWKQRLADEDRQRRDAKARQEAIEESGRTGRLKIEGLSEFEILDQVRIHLEKEPLEDPLERRAFAQAVLSQDLVRHWRQGRTRDPRTRVGKKKLRERARLLDRVRAEVDSKLDP